MTLSPEELKNLIQFAHKLADVAGEEALPYFRKPHGLENKDSQAFDPVTIADRNAEQAMRALIGKHYPQDGITGEELDPVTGTTGRDWILDPIDGTRSFITGLPIWGTLIGLAINDNPVLGMMSQAFTGERYLGVPGQAILSHEGNDTALKTRNQTDIEQAFLASTDPNLFKDASERQAFERVSAQARLTRFGGDCYLYCQLAAGQIDLVIESGLNIYDIMPLIPIIENAGGIVTNWQGNPTIGGNILAASNAGLHASALELLNK